MNKRTRNALIVVAVLAIVIVGAAALGRRGSGPALAVPVQKLALTTFTVKLPENGVVMHERVQTVPALVSGNIRHIYVRAGDRVARGELLATIYAPSLVFTAQASEAAYAQALANISASKLQETNAKVGYQAQVATSKSNLDEAQRVYNADVELFANHAIPRNQLDADRAKLDQARVGYQQAVEQYKLGAVSGYNGNSTQYAIAAAKQARITDAQNQQQLAFTQVRAPFAGVIQSVTAEASNPLRPLQPGDQIAAGTPLFTIAGGDRFIVRAQVDEQDIINVALGQRVLVTGQDFPGRTIQGHVAAIAPIATASTDASSTAKQVLTTVALEASPSYLRDGMNVDVDILTTSIPHAIVVPNDAVVRIKAKPYVYVVEKGVAHKRAIVTGKIGDTQTLVTAGLKAGETIVTHPLGVSDGARVKAAPSPSASPNAT